MIIRKMHLTNFRNYESLSVDFDPFVNILYGSNAQGKTNLLEAIWLFTGMRSFRNTREKNLIRFGKERSVLTMEYFNDVREQQAEITIQDKKSLVLGGVKKPSASSMVGEFLGTVFSPNHLELIKGGPGERRKFVNQALSELRPGYANRLMQFHKILQQRNTLLKDLKYHSELLETLDIWDETFASLSAYLIRERRKYLEQLMPHLQNFYSGISSGREQIEASYITGFPLEGNDASQWREPIIRTLQEHREEDILAGFSTVGPHRDDIQITLNGLSVKNFGSQGQQRSCALSMKMAEAAVIRQITGKQPVVLLDDVMSELDSSRQDYILNHIEGWQVFLTCCEPSGILLSKQSEKGNLFEIKGGCLCSST